MERKKRKKEKAYPINNKNIYKLYMNNVLRCPDVVSCDGDGGSDVWGVFASRTLDRLPVKDASGTAADWGIS